MVDAARLDVDGRDLGRVVLREDRELDRTTPGGGLEDRLDVLFSRPSVMRECGSQDEGKVRVDRRARAPENGFVPLHGVFADRVRDDYVPLQHSCG